jgi:acetyltransferase-like isoleucine patch superfamily enzyme
MILSKNNTSVDKIPSGVRLYAPFTLKHAVRRWWLLRNIGSKGVGVYVDANVQLLRHPERTFLGDKVMLKEGVKICPTHSDAIITIGDWTTIGYNVCIFSKSKISIGKNCLIAPFCYFVDSNHGTDLGCLIREQSMVSAPITVGDDVWLGAGVIVTKGVTIGSGSIVAAGSVVTKDIPPNTVFAGSPAKFIRNRE